MQPKDLPIDSLVVQRCKALINCNDILIYSQYKLFNNLQKNVSNFLDQVKIEYHPIYGTDLYHFTKKDVDNIYFIQKLTLPNGIQAAIVSVPQGMTTVDWYIFPRIDYFKFVKFLYQCTKNTSKKKQPVLDKPILEDDLYNEVYKETIGYLSFLKQYSHLDLKIKRGIILAGKPGNGKTMLCRHIKRLAKQEKYSVSQYTGADIQDCFTKNQLEHLMSESEIIFFDDVDMNYFNRNSGSSAIANGILSAMDGINRGTHASIRIFCTNEEPKNMDSAFLRPGRIDKIFKFELPTAKLKTRYIDTWIDESFQIFSKEEINNYVSSQDFSFAELAEMKNKLIIAHITQANVALEDFKPQTQQVKQKIGF